MQHQVLAEGCRHNFLPDPQPPLAQLRRYLKGGSVEQVKVQAVQERAGVEVEAVHLGRVGTEAVRCRYSAVTDHCSGYLHRNRRQDPSCQLRCYCRSCHCLRNYRQSTGLSQHWGCRSHILSCHHLIPAGQQKTGWVLGEKG